MINYNQRGIFCAMKTYCSKLGIYLLDFIAAILIGFLFQYVASLIVSLIIEMNQLAARIIKATLFFLATTAWLFFSSRTIGYKSKEFKLVAILIASALVFAIQQILAPIFHYAEYVSGGALDLTYAVFLKNEPLFVDHKTFIAEGVPQWGFHVIMLIIDVVFYLPAIIAGEHFGVKKRLKERDALINKGKGEQ